MPIELDDKEFDDVILEGRHKDLLKALKSIVTTLNETTDKSGIGEKQLRAIEELKGAIKNMPAPDVRVNIEQEKVIASLKKMEDGIVKELKERDKKEDKMQKWDFELKKNNLGNTTNIIATQIK